MKEKTMYNRSGETEKLMKKKKIEIMKDEKQI